MVLYADDNTQLMRYSNDVINALAIIDEFAEFSGLYMSKKKDRRNVAWPSQDIH